MTKTSEMPSESTSASAIAVNVVMMTAKTAGPRDAEDPKVASAATGPRDAEDLKAASAADQQVRGGDASQQPEALRLLRASAGAGWRSGLKGDRAAGMTNRRSSSKMNRFLSS